MVDLLFDGSFDGLLTAVFEAYEYKMKAVRLIDSRLHQPGFLDQIHEVLSDKAKADRVWTGLKKKIGAAKASAAFTVFLSENSQAHQHLFDFIRYIFDSPDGAESNFGHPAVIGVTQWQKSVSRERHRMKAFIRFERLADGIYYAPIEPDFNVLPLVVTFFKNRYADQRWLIYDLKRSYGMYYDLESVSEITLDASEMKSSVDSPFLPVSELDAKEELFGLLWNDYFRNTNIPARKNMKLHLRHVPKRYWKYLTEKKNN